MLNDHPEGLTVMEMTRLSNEVRGGSLYERHNNLRTACERMVNSGILDKTYSTPVRYTRTGDPLVMHPDFDTVEVYRW